MRSMKLLTLLCLPIALYGCGLYDQPPHRNAQLRHDRLKAAYLNLPDPSMLNHKAGVYLAPRAACEPVGDACWCLFVSDPEGRGGVAQDVDRTEDFAGGANGWHSARSELLKSSQPLYPWPTEFVDTTGEKAGYLDDITVRQIDVDVYSIIACGPLGDPDHPQSQIQRKDK